MIFEKLKRKLVLKKITGNLGKIVETEDKIICYVKKRKCRSNRFELIIPCKGIGQPTKDLAKKYNIDKKICYVIENIKTRSKRVYIFGYDDAEIIIKNSTFSDITTHINGKCTIDNVIFETYLNLMLGAKELTLKNIKLDNYFDNIARLGICIGADNELEIIDSEIGKQKQRIKISLLSPKIILKDSIISADEVKIETKKLESNSKSKIISKIVDYKVEDFDKINIESAIIKYNNEELNTKGEKIVLKKLNKPLELQRVKLLTTLKSIGKKCETQNEHEIEEYSKKLNKKKINEIIK